MAHTPLEFVCHYGRHKPIHQPIDIAQVGPQAATTCTPHQHTWAQPKRESPYPQRKGPHRSVGVRIPNSRGLQRGGENCEPVILNSTGRLTNWPGFLNSTGRLKAHNWADWLHHPCLLGVSMVGRNRCRKRVDVVKMNGYIPRHSPSPQARAPTHTGKRGGGAQKRKKSP